VQLGDPGNAGDDADWSVCSDQLPFDLYTLLMDASLTGIWFSNGNPFNGIINAGGIYTYIDYADQPCANDTALIDVTVQAAANAGINNTVTVCTTDAPFSLISVLLGTPQTGGTWTDPIGFPHPGVFNPAVDVAGLYTYTLSAIAPCEEDEAVVAIILDPCTGIGEVFSSNISLTWLGSEVTGTTQFAVTGLHNATVEIIDAKGRVASVWTGMNAIVRFAVSTYDLAPGLYSLRVQERDRVGAVRFMR
jgi:hypothetical protein